MQRRRAGAWPRRGAAAGGVAGDERADRGARSRRRTRRAARRPAARAGWPASARASAMRRALGVVRDRARRPSAATRDRGARAPSVAGQDAQQRALAGSRAGRSARGSRPARRRGRCRTAPPADRSGDRARQPRRGRVHVPIIWGGPARCPRPRSRSTRSRTDGGPPRLGALDVDALVRDAAALVQVPSVTGDERAALERLAEQARGARARHRPAPARPGRAARPPGPSRRGGAARRAVGPDRRRCPGTRPGRIAPERPRRRRLARHGALAARPVVGRGRGRAAARPRRRGHEGRRSSPRCTRSPRCASIERPEVVLQAVSSEEDGGLGTFAELRARRALRRRAAPRADRPPRRVRAGGRAHFKGEVRGRRRARRRAARRALGDRPLRARPRSVRRARARGQRGRHASADARARAAVPAARRPRRRRRVVEHGAGPARVRGPPRRAGRRGPRRGARRAAARRGRRARRRRAAVRAHLGGRRVRAGRDRAPTHPWVAMVQGRSAATRPAQAALAGVPWGADMRLFTARGIPAVMVGTRDIELAHAVDESVSIDELATVARTIVRAVEPAASRMRPASLRGLLGRVELALDEVQALVPEARVGEVHADDLAELLRRLGTARAQQVHVVGLEAGALLLVAAVDRQREQLPVRVRVHVAGGGDEVGDVGPPGAGSSR